MNELRVWLNPDLVVICLLQDAWANAFSAAQATGPDTVFRILLALDTSIERAEGKRYRKRRRLYSPSW